MRLRQPLWQYVTTIGIDQLTISKMVLFRESCGKVSGETRPSPSLLQKDRLYADKLMLVEILQRMMLGTVMAIATSSFLYLYPPCLGGYIKV